MLDGVTFPDERELSEALARADERAERLRTAVTEGVMAWLQEQGIDPDNPEAPPGENVE